MIAWRQVAKIISNTVCDKQLVDKFCDFFNEYDSTFNEAEFKKLCDYDPSWDIMPDFDAIDKYIEGTGRSPFGSVHIVKG